MLHHLQLLFGIEEGVEEEEDSIWLLYMFHKTLMMLYLIYADVSLLLQTPSKPGVWVKKEYINQNEVSVTIRLRSMME